MAVAEGSGTTITTVGESGGLRLCATGSPAGGLATGLDWATALDARTASPKPTKIDRTPASLPRSRMISVSLHRGQPMLA
jgi:hypothetical protein